MSKTFKITVLMLSLLTAAGVIWFRKLQSETRKHSPQQTLIDQQTGTTVVYCSPSVKGRSIFGGLVPFGEVWRTGANEATTFDNPVDVLLGGALLPAGQYTLWTIPGETEWEVIWNRGAYGWGVSWGGEAARQAEKDVLKMKVPVQQLNELQEQFEMGFSEGYFWLKWENTELQVPFEKA
jgi:hypothetical protein